jgi:lysophospholipase L1-like esterase
VRTVLLLAALAGATAACERAHGAAPSAITLTVLAFGDSITEGQNGDPPPGACGQLLCVDLPNAYPTLLLSRLETTYTGSAITVVNAGRGGEPAIAQGEARLPAELSAANPDALALLHGTNDAIGGQTPAAIAQALRNMIRTARSQGVTHIIVSTLLPQRPGGTPPRGTAAAAIPGINDAIRPMVTNEGAILVDAYASFVGHETTYLANDGLHVTPAGNQVLSQLFFQALIQALNR